MVRQPEKRLEYEYFKEHFADEHWQTRVWLGPLPPGKEAREYMVTGRWADAIVFTPDIVHIIEFKMDPNPGAIGQLDLYAQLFGKTLRFRRYWGAGIVKHLVTTRIDEHVKQLCDEHGCIYEVFAPDWVEYWRKSRLRL